jgi:hypothetical protein
MNSESKPNRKLLPQNTDNIERLNQALPIPIKPENQNLLPGESAQVYYARLESFRRDSEARTVLRWIVGSYFDSETHTASCRHAAHSATCYFTEVSTKRGKESAAILKNDVLDLLHTVIERNPSLQDLLQAQLKLLK